MINHTISSLTGPELRAYRRAVGINQTEMGRLAGISRHAVSYWECKEGFLRLYWSTPARMLEVLGVRVLPRKETSTRARGDGVLDDCQQARLDRESARLLDALEQKQNRRRVICGAKTRQGHPCKNKSEPGRRRCKFHGGLSTGPKTAEGRRRVSEAQKARWSKTIEEA